MKQAIKRYKAQFGIIRLLLRHFWWPEKVVRLVTLQVALFGAGAEQGVAGGWFEGALTIVEANLGHPNHVIKLEMEIGEGG